MEAAEAREAAGVEAAERWGLGTTTIGAVAERLRGVWDRYHHCLQTQTRDTSEQAWA